MSVVFHRVWKSLDQSCSDIWQWAMFLFCNNKTAVDIEERTNWDCWAFSSYIFFDKLFIRMVSGLWLMQFKLARVFWLTLVINKSIFKSSVTFPVLILIHKVTLACDKTQENPFHTQEGLWTVNKTTFFFTIMK